MFFVLAGSGGEAKKSEVGAGEETEKGFVGMDVQVTSEGPI